MGGDSTSGGVTEGGFGASVSATAGRGVTSRVAATTATRVRRKLTERIMGVPSL